MICRVLLVISYLSYLSYHHDLQGLTLSEERQRSPKHGAPLPPTTLSTGIVCLYIFSTSGHLVHHEHDGHPDPVLPSYVMIMLPILMMFNMNK